MATQIIDSDFFHKGWGTQELRAIFEDKQRLQYWLDIEAALAAVQGEIGMIPKAAAEEIVACCKLELLDWEFMTKNLAETGHVLVPLVRALEKRCKDGLGEYVHFGATTQDVVDTGGVLAIRDATKILLRDAVRLEKALLSLAQKYASFPMAGRTHHQQGQPITLGLKFANWAAELRRCIERLKDMSRRSFVIAMHGAVGTLASFGDHAYPILQGMAARLRLGVPPTSWSTARDGTAEYLASMAVLAGNLGRIANEVLVLSRTEVHELHEPLTKKSVGSSTMPHKRNAMVCEMTVGQARIVHANAQVGFSAMIALHERDARCYRTDLLTLPETTMIVGRMLEAVIFIIENLDIQEKNITRNLDLLGGVLLSEAVMFRLADKLGKQTAHHILHDLTVDHDFAAYPFRQRLKDNPQIMSAITADELEDILDYGKYLGQSATEVKNTVIYCAEHAKTDAQYLNM